MYSKEDPISTTRQGSICASGLNASAQKRKTLPMPRYGFTLFPTSGVLVRRNFIRNRNTLGKHVKSSEATKQRKYTSYARICVYMDISKALPGTITLEYQDEEWAQTIDYEHIPFRCRKCHEHGHLFRDFPLNAPPKPAEEEKPKDGFTQVQNHRRKTQKKPATNNGRKNPNTNSFEALINLPEAEEVENPHKVMGIEGNNNKENQQPKEHLTQGIPGDPQIHPDSGKELEKEEDTVMEMDEHDLAEIDLDRLEEALNKKDLQTLSEDQLRKVHKVFLDSSAGATIRLGIRGDPNSDQRRNPKENKRRGRKTDATTHQGSRQLHDQLRTDTQAL
jgi:hypothetical protein